MKISSLAFPARLLAPSVACAAYAGEAAPQPDCTITGNAAIVSDYMFRGIAQAWGDPATRGGGDLTKKRRCTAALFETAEFLS